MPSSATTCTLIRDVAPGAGTASAIGRPLVTRTGAPPSWTTAIVLTRAALTVGVTVSAWIRNGSVAV